MHVVFDVIEIIPEDKFEIKENLTETLAIFLFRLTKPKLNKRKIDRIRELNLYPIFIIEHLLNSQSMNLYYHGLKIMRNLARISPKLAAGIFCGFEESCANTVYHSQENGVLCKRSAIDKI